MTLLIFRMNHGLCFYLLLGRYRAMFLLSFNSCICIDRNDKQKFCLGDDCPSILQFDLSSSTIIQVIDTFLCQVTNPTPSPDPLSRGMQPQHQPHHTEQTLPSQVSSPQQPLLQAPSNIQSSAGTLYNPSPGLSEHSNKAPQGQGEQLSHTYGESQPYNNNGTKNLPQSKCEPSVPEATKPTGYSSSQGSNTVSIQNSFASGSSDEQDQTATVGDAAPVLLHTIPTAESYIGSPGAQRRDSNASSGRTPTQARFNRAGESGRLSSTVSLDELACLQKEPESDLSFKPEHANGLEDREDENQEDYKREIPAPQSHDFAHKSPSAEMTHEREMERQAFDPTPKNQTSKQHSEPSDGMFHTAVNPAAPQSVSETEAHSKTLSKDFSQGRPQDIVSKSCSPSQIDLLPTSQLHPASIGSQRAARPFSFMEYSQDRPMQPRPEVLQRAPSVESIPSDRYLNRPPSPVSPQRSMTRDVSEQTVSTHYDANHDSFTSDNGDGPLRRSRSFSRPFQDPNLQEHPAFRHEGPQTRGADIPTEYYSAQRPREETRLPRQQTTEYQLEGVGPPSVQRTETKSRSRHSSRSSVFFMNLGNSAKLEGQSKKSPEAQYAQSQAKDATASRKKSNRNSVFRTLTGRNGSDRDQPPSSVEQPVVQLQNSIPQQPLSAPRRSVEKDLVSSGTSGKVRNKLQRASTSGAPEKSVGKKKRFSAIGVSSSETLTECLR